MQVTGLTLKLKMTKMIAIIADIISECDCLPLKNRDIARQRVIMEFSVIPHHGCMFLW